MTNALAIEAGVSQSFQAWRCERCGAIIGRVDEVGTIHIQGLVRLGRRRARVECRVCHHKNTWIPAARRGEK